MLKHGHLSMDTDEKVLFLNINNVSYTVLILCHWGVKLGKVYYLAGN